MCKNKIISEVIIWKKVSFFLTVCPIHDHRSTFGFVIVFFSFQLFHLSDMVIICTFLFLVTHWTFNSPGNNEKLSLRKNPSQALYLSITSSWRTPDRSMKALCLVNKSKSLIISCRRVHFGQFKHAARRNNDFFLSHAMPVTIFSRSGFLNPVSKMADKIKEEITLWDTYHLEQTSKIKNTRLFCNG